MSHSANHARRRVLRGGIAAVPAVVLTLSGRPVLAGTQCVPCSAYGSLGGSLATKNLATCSGKSPSAWVSLGSWPTPYHPNGQDATLYHCPTTGLGGALFSGSTMRHVMNLSDDGATRTLGRYIAAALLNAKAGMTPTLSETTVRQMWNDVTTTGRFEPTAGIGWGPSEVITYIKSTIG